MDKGPHNVTGQDAEEEGQTDCQGARVAVGLLIGGCDWYSLGRSSATLNFKCLFSHCKSPL